MSDTCENLWNKYIEDNTKVIDDKLLQVKLPGLNPFTIKLHTKAFAEEDWKYIHSQIAHQIARSIQHQNAFYQYAYAGGVCSDVLNA